MTLEEFWDIIAASREDFDPDRRHGNMDLQAQRLEDLLAAMSVEQIHEYADNFSQVFYDAYRWDLWAAAYILNGGCSDERFVYFRYWLISLGRDVYEAAMEDPESLAAVARRPGIEACKFEEFGGIPGRILDEMDLAEPLEPPTRRHPPYPAGQRWDEDDLPRLFPKLWRQFGDATV